MEAQITQRFSDTQPAPKTTGERDAMDAYEGMLIYNIDNAELQVYTNTGWQAIATQQPKW